MHPVQAAPRQRADTTFARRQTAFDASRAGSAEAKCSRHASRPLVLDVPRVGSAEAKDNEHLPERFADGCTPCRQHKAK